MTDLLFRPAAAADLEHAKKWYDEQRPGLGDAFVSRVRTTLDRVVQNPEQFPIVYRETRRALVRRFPYSVFFRASHERVLVVAVMHFRRKPLRWRGAPAPQHG